MLVVITELVVVGEAPLAGPPLAFLGGLSHLAEEEGVHPLATAAG